ncbi:MAG: polymerase, sigma 29 subunit, SigE [Firmicutes bacterium]|nr:polymerase, sigma 29 subunit, SigE [Bacillota bacterium]
MLVDRYYPRMLNLFYRLTGTREQAEELTQELFVRLTRHVAGQQQVENVAAWLHRVGYNLWRDWVRRMVTAREKGITAEGGDAEIARLAGPNAVEAAALSHWEHAAVRKAVLTLSPAHREAVVLHYYQGLSYLEIAEITAVPVGTVRSRIHYAITQMRGRLGPQAEGGNEPWHSTKMRS